VERLTKAKRDAQNAIRPDIECIHCGTSPIIGNIYIKHGDYNLDDNA
jgi:hypothetical protein